MGLSSGQRSQSISGLSDEDCPKSFYSWTRGPLKGIRPDGCYAAEVLLRSLRTAVDLYRPLIEEDLVRCTGHSDVELITEHLVNDCMSV